MTVSGTENGKSNTRYDNSSGIIHMSCNGNTGLSKGSVIMPNDRAIGCVNETSIPFTRVKCLVDENGTMHTIMSECSSTELVNDHKRRRLLHHKHSCRFILLGLLLLFGLLIIVLTVLYVKESERTSEVRIVKVLDRLSPDCFVRATPRQIEHVKREKEIADASKSCDFEIKQRIQEGTFHAISLSVSYMGQKIWSFTHGRMNYSDSHSYSINEDTPFPIASISKVFTVIMLRKLIDMQVIKSIDDEIVKYEESFFVNNPFNQDNITFRQLACMMSGLPREAPCYSAESETSSDTRKDKYNLCPFNSDDMLKKLQKVSLVLRPGSEPSYSNLALGILGDVLGRLLKNNQTLEEWVKQNIIEKLGMTNTGYIIGKNNSKFPVSSVNSKRALIVDWGWLRSAGGMYSSVNDLGKLGNFFLEGVKSLLSKPQVDGLLKPAYIWSDGYAQGCPFEMQPSYLDDISLTHNQMNYISYQKGGYIFGYGSLFKLIPALQLNMNGLVASPIEGAADEITTIVSDSFTEAFDKLLKRKKPQYKLPSNAEAFVGSYRLRTFWPLINRPCNITLENDMLVLNIEWLRASLSQKSKWTLVSGNLDDIRCVILGIGLLRDEYTFIEPKSKSGKSPGFVVNSISSSGYLRFDRIEK